MVLGAIFTGLMLIFGVSVFFALLEQFKAKDSGCLIEKVTTLQWANRFWLLANISAFSTIVFLLILTGILVKIAQYQMVL